MARGTCHMPRSDLGPEPSSFRRSGASDGAYPVPIGLFVWPPEQSAWTYCQIYRVRPPYVSVIISLQSPGEVAEWLRPQLVDSKVDGSR